MKHIVPFTFTALLLMQAIILSPRAVATPVVGDTITELRIYMLDSTMQIYTLSDRPLLTFNGDSVDIVLSDTTMHFFHSEIVRYSFCKRVATVRVDSTVCESSLPLTWNGTVFTEAGIQSAVTTASVGGDSTIVMTLHVLPTLYSTYRHTIVENQLPYTFNGYVYTDAVDNDTVTLTSAMGCDSIIVFSLVVHYNAYTMLADTVCESALPFVWNGHTFYDVESYVDTFSTVSGADSIVTMSLAVKPTVYTTVHYAVSESSLPYFYAGRTYMASARDTLSFTSSSGCDSVVFFNLTVYNSQSIVVDSTVCESALPIVWNDSVFTAAGVKITTLSSLLGGDSIVTMILHVTPTVFSNVSEVVLENNMPHTFLDSTYYSSGNDTVNLVSVSGCDSIIYYSLTVISNVMASIDSTVCESELPLVWNDSVFTAAGEKQAVFMASTGADSIVNMILYVIPTMYSTIHEIVLENDMPHTYLGHTYNDSANDTITLVSANGCDSIIYYWLTVAYNVFVSIDSSVCESELPIVWNWLTFNTAGTQSVTLRTSIGADSMVTMTLNVIPTTYGEYFDTIVANELPYRFLHHLYNDAVENDTLMLISVAGCDSVLTYHLFVQDTEEVAVGGVVVPECLIRYDGRYLVVSNVSVETQLSLFTITGCLLESRRVHIGSSVSLPLDGLAAGVYLVKANNQVYKIVKL